MTSMRTAPGSGFGRANVSTSICPGAFMTAARTAVTECGAGEGLRAGIPAVLLPPRRRPPPRQSVRPVADEDVHLAIRCGELDAESAGDLVAHARVAVLHVVAVRIGYFPELVQVAGHRARSTDDDVARACGVVDGADDFALRRKRR